MKKLIKRNLTPTQQGIYFDQLRMPDIPCYNEGVIGDIEMSIDPETFKKALDVIVTKIDSLTIDFRYENDELVQFFGWYSSFDCDLIDLTHCEHPRQRALELVQQRFSKALKLGCERLVDGCLYKISESSYLFDVRFHHILSDAHGMAILIYAINPVYKALQKGDADINLDGIYPFSDEIEKELAYVGSKKYQLDKEFWSNKFKVLSDPVLPAKRPHNHIEPSHRLTSEIPNDVAERLKAMCREYDVSMQHIGISALVIYFAKTLGREELLIGIPVHRRRKKYQRGILATYTSDLPCKFDLAKCIVFNDVLQEVTAELRRNYRHQRYPKAHLSRDLGLLGKDREQLAEVFFNFQGFATFPLLDGSIDLLRQSSGYEQDPMHIRLCDYGDSQTIKINIDFRDEYMSLSEGKLFSERYLHLLGQISKIGKDVCWRNIDIYPFQEKALLESNEQGRKDNSKEVNPIAQIQAQAQLSARKVAVQVKKEKYTYKDLVDAVDNVAFQLIHEGLVPGDRVIVAYTREFMLIVSILAVLRSGGVYVPVDRGLPEKRIEFLLQDSGASFCISNDARVNNLAKRANIPILSSTKAVSDVELTSLQADQLAYLIYTSGTTGKPKGVMVEHQQLTHFIKAMTSTIELSSQMRLLAMTSVAFDIHILELLLPLTVGATIVLTDTLKEVDVDCLLNEIESEKVNVIQATPSAWRILLDGGFVPKTSITMLSGGEYLPQSIVSQLQPSAEYSLWNLYGPTETTVWVSCHAINGYTAIGSAMVNTDFILVNKQCQPTGLNVIGELWIAGNGVARGYWQQPELTRECFIEASFRDDLPKRFYRTGDLFSWQLDANGGAWLQYHGRIDEQIKLRGHRVETAEIEHYLRQSKYVLDGCVVMHELANEEKFLVMYVIPTDIDQNSATLQRILHQELSDVLPSAVIPQYTVMLSEMPLTVNGKLDKSALNRPVFGNDSKEEELTETELKLAEIWQSLLGLIDIPASPSVSFFELGGNSVLLIRFKTLLKKCFEIDIPIERLFQLRTLTAISSEVDLLTQQQKLLIAQQQNVTEREF